MNKRGKAYGREVPVVRSLNRRRIPEKKRKSPNDGRRTSIIGGFPIRSGTSNRGGGDGLSSNFLKLALTTGVVLSFAIIFFVFNTFGETKINVTITSNPDLNKGLVGHWTFDGPDMTSNVADTSGNGNTGYLNGFTSTTTVPGKIGQALSFDGVNDYVEVPNNSSLNPSNITISVWAKSNTSTWNDYGFLASKRSAYILHPLAGTTDVRTYIYTTTWVDTTCTASNPITEWNQYVFSWDGTTIRCYINGTQGTPVNPGGSINTSDTGSLFIGKDDGFTRFFDGSIDDVRIYNRSLSAKEIKRLYQQGATTYLNKTLVSNSDLNKGLVGYWTFDGVLNTQITDQSGNGNTGYFGASSNATNTLPTIGKIGQAVKFDGIGDNMVIGNGVLNQTEPNGFSAFMWLKSSETTNGRYFFERGGSDSFTMKPVYPSESANCRIRNSVGTYFTTPSALVLDGKWHQVGCSFSTTTKAFTMYVDGASTTSVSAVAFDKFIDNANWFTIGARNGGGSAAKGTIDDFRVYNRSLSANEVKRLYQQGATTYINKTIASSPDLNRGLVGHWTFDGPDLLQNVADSSGNGNTGYLKGFTSTTTVPGKIGQALSFDGVDDKIDLGTPAALELTSSFTIAAWVKPSTGGCCKFIFSRGNTFQGYKDNQYEIGYHYANDGTGGANNHPDIYFRIGDGVTYNEFVYSGANLVVGQWTFLACQLSDSSTLQCFINGVAVGTPVAATITPANSTDATYIGSDKSNGGFTAGSLDDVRVYNRALSVKEIKRLYDLGNQ